MIKQKKASTPFSNLLLVIMALILFGTAMFVFLTAVRKPLKKISDATFIEDAYAKEEQINFLLSHGINLEKSIKLVEGAELTENMIKITEKSKDGEIAVFYKFKPKIKKQED